MQGERGHRGTKFESLSLSPTQQLPSEAEAASLSSLGDAIASAHKASDRPKEVKSFRVAKFTMHTKVNRLFFISQQLFALYVDLTQLNYVP